MAQKDIGNKVPIHTLKSTEQVRDFYNDWGNKNKYNQDMLKWSYTGPSEIAYVLNKYAKNKDILIFDAGCGSGLVGEALKRSGFSNFHGADLSQTLLKSVPDQLYKKLIQTDLNKPIDMPNNTFDAITCVGTFTYGHVKAAALDEFIRITKNEGLICFTINEGIYEEHGFDKKIASLEAHKNWRKLEFFKSDYLASKDVHAWLGLYEVIKVSDS